MKQQRIGLQALIIMINIKKKKFRSYIPWSKDIPLHRHIQAELWYVLNGKRGYLYQWGTLSIRKRYIFMYVSLSSIWSIHYFIRRSRDHPFLYRGVYAYDLGEAWTWQNAQLVYETRPYMKCEEPYIKKCIMRLCKEQQEKQFGAKNLILYLTMEIHMLFCRYALSSKINKHMMKSGKPFNIFCVHRQVMYHYRISQIKSIAIPIM